MEVEIPDVVSGGGSGDYWKRTGSKHTLRFFPFRDSNGKLKLAVSESTHFVNNTPHDCEGPGCAYCKEAADTKNRRLRAVHRMRLLVIDMDAEEQKLQPYDCPTSVYKKLKGFCDEAGDPAEILGNEGVDFVLKYDGDAQPSSQYQLIPKLKGSEVLDISDDDLPNLEDESAFAQSEEETEEAVEPAGETCVFKDSKNKEIQGLWTGKQKKGKYVIEANGRLWTVAPENVVECEALGVERGAGQKALKSTGGKKKPTKKKAVSDDPVLEVGGQVTFTDPDTGESANGKVKAIDGEAGTVEITDGEYDYELDITEVEPC